MATVLERAGDWVQFAMTLWFYVIMPLAIIAGSWIYLQRNAATQFGIGRDYENEGNLEEALKHYERAARAAAGRPESLAAKAKVDELRARMQDDD